MLQPLSVAPSAYWYKWYTNPADATFLTAIAQNDAPPAIPTANGVYTAGSGSITYNYGVLTGPLTVNVCVIASRHGTVELLAGNTVVATANQAAGFKGWVTLTGTIPGVAASVRISGGGYVVSEYGLNYRVLALYATTLPAGAVPFSNDSMFRPTSYWRQKLAPDAPLNPNSARWSKNVCEQMDCRWDTPAASSRVWQQPGANPGQAWFSHDQGGSPLYVVGPNVPTQKVNLYQGGQGNASGPLLQKYWNKVPIPEPIVAGNSSDKTVCIWQPSTDTMWEFWVFYPDAGPDYKYTAKWGGTMLKATQNPGVYGWRVNPDGTPWEWPYWGHTASSLPINAGAVQPEELDRGYIGHALHLTVGDAAREFISPAYRTDGSGRWFKRTDGTVGSWRAGCTSIEWPDMVPEGAHLRFPASLDLTPYTGLTRLLVEAIRDYGMIVTDVTHGGCSVRFRESSTYRAAGLPNPWHSRFSGWPNDYLWAMPLHKLQVIA